MERATSWSITINNPTASDDENLALAKQKGWKVIGQLEKGDNGTPHYQLLVKTPQVRFSAIKKAFPRAHIEVARNVEALEEYVQKDDTRVGQLPTTEQYPSMTKLWDLFYEWSLTNHMFDEEYRGEEWLIIFDKCICCLIRKGYIVETMAVNPQIRSIVKNYIRSIFERCENIRRQKTDRQTEILSEVNSITNAGQETICETQTDESSSSS